MEARSLARIALASGAFEMVFQLVPGLGFAEQFGQLGARFGRLGDGVEGVLVGAARSLGVAHIVALAPTQLAVDARAQLGVFGRELRSLLEELAQLGAAVQLGERFAERVQHQRIFRREIACPRQQEKCSVGVPLARVRVGGLEQDARRRVLARGNDAVERVDQLGGVVASAS